MTEMSLKFDAAFEMTRDEVNRILLAAPRLIRAYTSYLTQTHGKMIRARAVLACAMDESGSIREDAVTFAAAIEVLHLATLVHDDIMDDADLRRGMETLQKKYGKRTAVICGDYLLSAAIRELDRVKNTDDYKKFGTSGYVEQICMGELRQNTNNRNYDLSMFRYLSIINGKTAALFEASYFAGAVTHETEEARLRLYRRLGRYTGVIFQLTDDCIDYENDTRAAGKSVQSDYEQGVITLPVIYTFSRKPELKERAAVGALSKEEMLGEVKKSGGISFTHQTAKRYYEKAQRALHALEFSNEKAEILQGLLDKSYYGLKK
ncbi:MAG: polyprenyl synthetase family protein [Roseburia sp.]|nr:polyprenyl synthetase family protein [Roseburia sp.]